MDLVSGGALLIALGAILAYFRHLPAKIYALIERLFITKIDIQEEDESFQWMKLWLANKLQGSLSVSVFTRKNQKPPGWEDSPNEIYKYAKDDNLKDKRPRILFTPAPGWYWMTYNGKFVSVSCNRMETDNKSETTTKPRESLTLRILSRDLSIAKRMLEEARDFALPQDGKVEIRTCSQNYWSLSGRIRPRPIDSVILSDNIGERILKDITKFQRSSEWYTKLGVPYRRGYLIYGPNGSGKTSLILSIASELGMNVNLLSLSTPGINDSKVIELLSSVDTNTLVLIEDIDCAFNKRAVGTDRKGKLDFGLTFSGLLNALDGILSQDGRIVFMTTNHPEKLDPALIRPGRADFKVYIGNATQDQIYRLFRRFHPDKLLLAEKISKQIPNNEISMASIQHHLMLHRDDPEAAVCNINDLLKVEEYAKVA